MFDWACMAYGPFSLDVAADADNTLCKKYYTKEDNALEQSWLRTPGRSWCNPPYSNIQPWVEKAADEARYGSIVVMLIPSFNGELYHQTTFEEAYMITHIVGRVPFVNREGTEVKGNTRGSMLVLFQRGGFSRLPIVNYINRDHIKNYEWKKSKVAKTDS